MLFFIVLRRGISLSIINITDPNHDQNDHHIKLVIVYQISGPLVQWFKTVEKCQKLRKGHNFVKIMTNLNLK